MLFFQAAEFSDVMPASGNTEHLPGTSKNKRTFANCLKIEKERPILD